MEGKFRSQVKWQVINYSIHPEQVTIVQPKALIFFSLPVKKQKFITIKVSTWVFSSSKILQPEQLVAILVLSAYCTLYVYKNTVLNVQIYILRFNWHAQIWRYSGVKCIVAMEHCTDYTKAYFKNSYKENKIRVFNKVWKRKLDWVMKLTVLSITCKKIFL